ncbi:MAG TPA: hypothetical protein VFN57_14530 [Thermomicrobiaceae bacterium]|nr:hypothetical protein [Thermomicrobiaceae bacterium]
MTVVGIAVSLLLILVYLWTLEGIWRVPFRALGVLVAGLAIQSVLIMLLLRLRTPHLLLRIIQEWMVGLFVVLGALALRLAWRALRGRRRPAIIASDVIAGAFTALILVYAILPRAILPGRGSPRQTLGSLAVLLLLPGLYLCGRVFRTDRREDLRWVARALLATAMLVGLLGVIELWFVPSRLWIHWGVAGLGNWLDTAFSGPGGLPETFFQSIGPGLALRRLVSTFLNPTGVAVTGLLIAPLAVAVLGPWRVDGLAKGFRWAAVSLLALGVILSLSWLVVAALVVEAVLLAVLLHRREVVIAAGGIIVASLLVLFLYPARGPVVTSTLADARPPAGYTLVRDLARTAARLGLPGTPRVAPESTAPTSARLPAAGSTDGLRAAGLSLRGDFDAALEGLSTAWRHPLGIGLQPMPSGAQLSAGTGSGALSNLVDEVGILGGLLFLAFYGLAVASAFRTVRRTPRDPLATGFALITFVGGLALLPIMLSTDIWSVTAATVLFWWTAGMNAGTAPDAVSATPAPLPTSIAAAGPVDAACP